MVIWRGGAAGEAGTDGAAGRCGTDGDCGAAWGKTWRANAFQAGRGPAQSGQNAVMHSVKDGPLGEKLDLDFGGMDIDIYGFCWHRDLKDTGRKTAHHDLIFIGILQRGGERLGFDIAAVDKKVLIAAAAAGGRWALSQIPLPRPLPLVFHRDHLQCSLAAKYRIDRAEQFAISGRGEHFFSVTQKAEGHLRMGQGLLLHGGKRIGRLQRYPA